jgi:Pentapeptide repeats (8 copies)
MYVWLVCFVVLFGLAELYPWVQGVVLPLPVMLLAGVGLAIASNLSASNLSGSNLSASNLSGSNLSGSNLSGSNLSGSKLNQRSGLSAPSTPVPQVPAVPLPQNLPQSSTPSPSPDTISFTIRKP